MAQWLNHWIAPHEVSRLNPSLADFFQAKSWLPVLYCVLFCSKLKTPYLGTGSTQCGSSSYLYCHIDYHCKVHLLHNKNGRIAHRTLFGLSITYYWFAETLVRKLLPGKFSVRLGKDCGGGAGDYPILPWQYQSTSFAYNYYNIMIFGS